MARINRALQDGTQLHKCRKTSRLFGRCGIYWLQDVDGRIVKEHINLENMGREVGVIAEWEVMAGHDNSQRESPTSAMKRFYAAISQ